MRTAQVTRESAETKIQLDLNLDGSGDVDIHTGVGFFDHMLTHIAYHGGMDLRIAASGDLQVDAHHTVEDTGICLGKACAQALGEVRGIRRYGHAVVPMDEALCEATLDFSGRPVFVYRAHIPKVQLGQFDAELAEEFFRAFSSHARCTLHIELRYGSNVHHCIEGLFKAFARAWAQAVARDPAREGAPSTKGVIEA